MGCIQSTATREEEEPQPDDAPIDVRFSNTSVDGKERNSSTHRPSPLAGSTVGGGQSTTSAYGRRNASSRGLPSPSLSSVSLVPVARTGSYDQRAQLHRHHRHAGHEGGVKETSRLVVDHLKGNVFINQYLIIKDLGKGAHGTVKLVYNTQDDMLYAMKVIHKRRMRRQSYLAEPRAVANMMRNVALSPLSGGSHTEGHRGPSPLASPRQGAMTDEYGNEIAVMKELDHPNLVKLYEVIYDPSNNKLLMIMEYVEGGCVLAGSSAAEKVPIPENTAVKYFRDVVKGLEYLHFNRIVHGDLKPDNLLMSSSGKVKISDFGSARFCEKSDTMFATAGTPVFMAPEMCQGKPFNGFPGDIWALGICLYMFVYGKPPFNGGNTYQIYEAIQNTDLHFPEEPKASGQLQDLLRRLLVKDPLARTNLEEIKTHPWVTQCGALPALQTSAERAVQRVFEAMRMRNANGGSPKVVPSTVPLAPEPQPLDIDKLVPDAEIRAYEDGETIIRQGEKPEGLYYIQEGFVDLLYKASEKKLVADEDFADAISDDEEEDEEPLTPGLRNSACGLGLMPVTDRKSGRSGEDGGKEGADGKEGDEDGEEDGTSSSDGHHDDFMAIFASHISERVSPMGSFGGSQAVSRHGSIVPVRHPSMCGVQLNVTALHNNRPSPGSGSPGLMPSTSGNSSMQYGGPSGGGVGHSPRYGSPSTGTPGGGGYVMRGSMSGGGGVQYMVSPRAGSLSAAGATTPTGVASPSPLGRTVVRANEEAARIADARSSIDTTRAEPPPSPFTVPSPAGSPASSRRQLVAEVSFNPRNMGDVSSAGTPLSPQSEVGGNNRSYLPQSQASTPPASLGGFVQQKVVLTPTVTGRQDADNTCTLPHRLSRAGGAHDTTPYFNLRNGSIGELGAMLQAPIPSTHMLGKVTSRQGSSLLKRNGSSAMAASHQAAEELAELSTAASRRLSVTTGNSFKHGGGPGSSVAAVASSSTAMGGRSEGDGESYPNSKAESQDSIISNADITMQPGAHAGWRHERPTPVLVGSGGALGPNVTPPRFIMAHMAAAGAAAAGAVSSTASAGSAAGPAAAHAAGTGSGGGASGAADPSLRKRFMDNLRRSLTHDELVMAVPIPGPASGGAASSAGGAGPSGSAYHPHPHVLEHVASLPVGSAEPLAKRRSAKGRVRRHSTSSPNSLLNRLTGVPAGEVLDRNSIQEWSTTSKLAQKAIQRSDSMHSRMAQMVMRARQQGVRRKRRGSMELMTTRGPGSVVGELCIDGKPSPSSNTVVAKGHVKLLLIRNEKVNKYRNQPSVMAALHRSQNASLVQEAMERFVECEQEVAAVEIIRRTITTEPQMSMQLPELEYVPEHDLEHSMPALMADIYPAA